MSVSDTVIKRITLSRYLFELAVQNARSEQAISDAACVNLLQDAIEVFFLAALDALKLPMSKKAEFPQYFDRLSEHLAHDLPYRHRLLELNKVRVLSKHDGVTPNRHEIDGYISAARNFLEETCTKTIGIDYWTASLIDLLDDNETKGFMRSAEAKFQQHEFGDCLVECRKALFVEFETDYDTQKDLRASIALFGSKAPYFARDKDFISRNVKTHFDYIYLDHRNLDGDLMGQGIDNVAFWNVWRLTPRVYRYLKDDDWVIQLHPTKTLGSDVKDRASYVLSTLVSILLAKQQHRKLAKYDGYQPLPAKLRKKEIEFFEKADRGSPIVGRTPPEVEFVLVEYACQGLNDKDLYWRASFHNRDIGLAGFVLASDLIGS